MPERRIAGRLVTDEEYIAHLERKLNEYADRRCWDDEIKELKVEVAELRHRMKKISAISSEGI